MEPSAALSVDFELFSHTPAYRRASGTLDEEGVGIEGVEFLLDAFNEADAIATFFTVSEIANRFPAILDRVVDGGHEIASHTHTHRHLTELTDEECREELAQSKTLLETRVGGTVTGFRAPSFKVTPDHFDLLEETAYRYDSSFVPAWKIPGWYGGEFRISSPTPASAIREDAPDGITEIPVGVMPWLRLPLTGAWLRFFGVKYTIAGMRWLARQGIAPVLYVHPWEFVELPSVQGIPKRVYWRTGDYVRRAVQRILAEPFTFVSMQSLAESADAGRWGSGSP